MNFKIKPSEDGRKENADIIILISNYLLGTLLISSVVYGLANFIWYAVIMFVCGITVYLIIVNMRKDEQRDMSNRDNWSNKLFIGASVGIACLFIVTLKELQLADIEFGTSEFNRIAIITGLSSVFCLGTVRKLKPKHNEIRFDQNIVRFCRENKGHAICKEYNEYCVKNLNNDICKM
jgi:hypothetical protein